MLQKFLALKYILFYFVYIIGQNNVGQKRQIFCPTEILPFSDASEILGVYRFFSSVTHNAPAPNGS